MRADRLVSLVLLLQARGRLAARALAAELEVSVRTVYRDIAALNTAGVPVLGVPAAVAELGLADALAAAHRKISITAGNGHQAPALIHLDMPR